MVDIVITKTIGNQLFGFGIHSKKVYTTSPYAEKMFKTITPNVGLNHISVHEYDNYIRLSIEGRISFDKILYSKIDRSNLSYSTGRSLSEFFKTHQMDSSESTYIDSKIHQHVDTPFYVALNVTHQSLNELSIEQNMLSRQVPIYKSNNGSNERMVSHKSLCVNTGDGFTDISNYFSLVKLLSNHSRENIETVFNYPNEHLAVNVKIVPLS